jgi:phage terminase large subunit-like protein
MAMMVMRLKDKRAKLGRKISTTCSNETSRDSRFLPALPWKMAKTWAFFFSEIQNFPEEVHDEVVDAA